MFFRRRRHRTVAGRSSIYERIGGETVISTVLRVFYDKVYAHPWIGRYFSHNPRQHIVAQQTLFMMKIMGGPDRFGDKTPAAIHAHIFITDELFDLRASLLYNALCQCGVDDDIAREWMLLDGSFRRSVVKKSESQCRVEGGAGVVTFSNPLV